MIVKKLLTEVIEKNIELTVKDNILKIKSLKGTLTATLKNKIRAYEKDIISFLNNKNNSFCFLHTSEKQTAIWHKNQQNNHYYRTYRLNGCLNIVALKKAFNALVQRHQTLRTHFAEVDGMLLQIIAKKRQINVQVIDKTTNSIGDAAARLLDHPQFDEPQFDIAAGSLIDINLLHTASNQYSLRIALHPIIADAHSIDVLQEEWVGLYDTYHNGAPLPAPPKQYAEFLRHQHQWLNSEEKTQQLDYWRTQLANAPTLLELPTDRPRPVNKGFLYAKELFTLPRTLTKKINTLSKKEHISLLATLTAAFELLLYRYSGQTDISVGMAFPNCPQAFMADIIGPLQNTAVVRTRIDSQASLKTFLQQVHTTGLGAEEHQALPFECLIKALDLQTNTSYSPLCQVALTLELAAEENVTFSDLTACVIENHTPSGDYDLAIHIKKSGQSLQGCLTYDSDLFDSATVQRMLKHYHCLLANMADNPEQTLANIPLLSEAERQQILVDWNETTVSYPQDQCIHQLFEAQVAKTPEAIAVTFEEKKLTYEALNQKSNQLAHYLIGQGAGPEIRVGLCVERSLEMIIGLLGILKAGGAYVPIDPKYPRQRINHLIHDSRIKILLTQKSVQKQLPLLTINSCCIDKDWETISIQSITTPKIHITCLNLAYVIYTSGSTGKPKGVSVSHKSLYQLCFWHKHTFSVAATTKSTQLAGIGFDAMAWEVWPYLMVGAELMLVPPDLVLMPELFIDWLHTHNITHCFAPTPLTESLFGETWPSSMVLQYLLTGGDQLKKAPPADLPFTLVNNYGPTENTVVATSGIISSNGSIPPNIGRPIHNTRVYILDNTLNPVPVSVVGELYLGGEQLARGYLERPKLTSDRFVADPFSEIPGMRLYKTGDLACFKTNGNIEYKGRTDDQVKVRGFRIELGEIESVLAGEKGIREVVVLSHSREKNARNHYLVAYVVCDKQFKKTIDKTVLRTSLEAQLPNYMIPSFFIFLDKLPLTPNGKVDKKALPEPDATNLSTQIYISPHTETEKKLTIIWSKIFDLPSQKIGTNITFLELGGHSLLATRMVSEIRQVFNTTVQLADIFSANTIQTLAQVIDTTQQGQELLPNDINAIPITLTDRTQHLPLSFAQQRLWFIDQLEGGADTRYNEPLALQLKGVLDLTALKQAIQATIERHESLRTTFHTIDGEPVQVITDVLTLDIPVFKVTEVEAPHYIEEHMSSVFDLTRGPLIKVSILQLGPNEHSLLINMHHIVCDGWSMEVLGSDLAGLYTRATLQPLALQYADFSHWQRQWLQGEALDRQQQYWRTQLAHAPALLELPTDRPRPAAPSGAGCRYSFNLPTDLMAPLRQLGQKPEQHDL